MQNLDNFRLNLGGKEFVPIMIGGMGVNISTNELALTAARLGGIGHVSDAMVHTVADRLFSLRFVRDKLKKYKDNVNAVDKAIVKFDLGELSDATHQIVDKVMSAKEGLGLVFINCMEKLTMNAPLETLKVRLCAALDAGIDGITLAAGLHLNSFALIEDHPRFRDAKLGIIVSSLRALQIFLKKSARTNRLPDYVVVEGPLAGGHLGFGADWAKYNLAAIVAEIRDFLHIEKLNIPLIAAGGVFTGGDAVSHIQNGASAVQVATRFSIAAESGLTDEAKQAYLAAEEADIEVNMISPTGYPMRMLKNSPAIGTGTHPNCESFGYLLDARGKCSYIDAYEATKAAHPEQKRISVKEKTCLCTHMRNYDVWTCGHFTYRLKDTTVKNADGSYLIPSAEHVFKDYQFSAGNDILLPKVDA